MIRIIDFLPQFHLLLFTLLHLTLNSLCFLNPHLVSGYETFNIFFPLQDRLNPIILEHVHHELPVTLAAQAPLFSLLIIELDCLWESSLTFAAYEAARFTTKEAAS